VEIQFLNETQDYTNDQVAGGVQDFIICIEMFVAAIAHIWIFPYREFYDENSARAPQIARIASVFNPTDLALDMHTHILRPATQRIQIRGKQVQTSIFTVCCENDEIQLTQTDIKSASLEIGAASNTSGETIETKINLIEGETVAPSSELSTLNVKTDFSEVVSPRTENSQNLNEKLLPN